MVDEQEPVVDSATTDLDEWRDERHIRGLKALFEVADKPQNEQPVPLFHKETKQETKELRSRLLYFPSRVPKV